MKLPDDPCPSGFEIPSKSDWDLIKSHNVIESYGNWIESSTNYGSGKRIGSELMLPSAGHRRRDDGTLDDRGTYGFYWSQYSK
jgi:hypothetical protein